MQTSPLASSFQPVCYTPHARFQCKDERVQSVRHEKSPGGWHGAPAFIHASFPVIGEHRTNAFVFDWVPVLSTHLVLQRPARNGSANVQMPARIRKSAVSA